MCTQNNYIERAMITIYITIFITFCHTSTSFVMRMKMLRAWGLLLLYNTPPEGAV